MKIHFIGIGGVAVSGLALLAKKQGHKVQGSDAEHSEITDLLKKRGVKVFIGHKASYITKEINRVVFSEAVPKNNPELKQAKKLGLKTLGGAEFLAEIARNYFLIAVSGMHGKTTTASMLAEVLTRAKFDPSYIIGAKNAWRLGNSKYLIIEADDYKAKLLNYHPELLILTNIEEEHLDYFQNLKHIHEVFTRYIGQVRGVVVANKDDKNILQVLKNVKTQNSNVKTKAKNLKPAIATQKLKIKFYSLRQEDGKKIKKFLQVPGRHNISNALAVLAACRALGIKDDAIFKGLARFKGAWRRLEEKKIRVRGREAVVVSDYGHHPTEIKASMQAVKEKYPEARTLLVFQPHQYQRTFYLFDKFVKVFQGLNCQKIIITDIYTVKGRESAAIKRTVSAQKLVRAVNQEKTTYLPWQKLPKALKTAKTLFDVIVIMGAGNIYKLADKL